MPCGSFSGLGNAVYRGCVKRVFTAIASTTVPFSPIPVNMDCFNGVPPTLPETFLYFAGRMIFYIYNTCK